MTEFNLNHEEIIENMYDGILMLNITSRKTILVNKSLCRMTGYTKEELMKLRADEIYPNENKSDILHQLDQLAKKEITVARNIPVKKKEGGTIFADISASLLNNGENRYLICTFHDITQRLFIETNLRNAKKEMEEALFRAEQHSKEVTSLLGATRSVLKYSVFNEAARAIFDSCKKIIGARSGYVALLSEDGAENEVLFLDSGGLPCSVDENLPMPIRGLRGETYKTGKAVYDNNFIESKWVKFMPEGHVILNNVMFAPLNLEGKTIGLMGLANKNTPFTEHDRKLATAFSELAAIALNNSKALESLETSRREYQLACDQTELYKDIFAHDIRNILQNMKSSIELIGSMVTPSERNEQMERILEIMNEQIIRGAKLVSNIQKLSEIDDGTQELEKVEVFTVLNQSISYVKESHTSENIYMRIDSTFKELHVNANELLLDVFDNILLNALKYNNSKVKLIKIKVLRELKGSIPYVKLEFIDNGIGVPETLKGKLFKEIIKDKNRVKGMGLGLLTVKKILDIFNATIGVEDNVKGDVTMGSNFIISLPEAK